jgi:Tol biopolymer transport system component
MKLIRSAGFFFLALTPLSFSEPRFYPPVNLGPKINSTLHELAPFLSADGKKFLFVRDFDLWYAEWTDTGWTDPKSLGPKFNTGPGIEHSPSISPDGQKLFFVPDLRDGFFWDVWVSIFDSATNDWGTPVNLGAPVNTSGAEYSAHLAPDGNRLYFSSDGAGRCGIYVSDWNGANWSTPIKVSVSSCAVDEYASVTADNRWYYFFRYLPDSGGSIFVSSWTGSDWGPPSDLWPQFGRGGTPFITPSGESLFFASSSLGGLGGADIWMARRIVLGDLNLDSRHSPADVVLELNKVFLDQSYPAPEERGDMNCDAAFSPADVVRLLLLVFENTPPEC